MPAITTTTYFNHIYSNSIRPTGESFPNPGTGATWYAPLNTPNIFDNISLATAASADDTQAIQGYPGFATTQSNYYLPLRYSAWIEAADLHDKIPENATVYGVRVRLLKSTGYDYPSGDYATVKDQNAYLAYGTYSVDENISPNNKAVPYRSDLWPTSGWGYTTYGGETDLWGFDSLLGSTINSSNFRFLFQVNWDEQGVDKSMPSWGIDHLEVVVSYDANINITQNLIGSQELVQPPQIVPGPVFIRETNPGLDSTQNVSTPVVRRNINQQTIVSTQDVQPPIVRRSIFPSTITSAEKVISTTDPVSNGTGPILRQIINPVSISDLSFISSPVLVRNIKPNTIISQESITGHLLRQNIYPNSIDSQQIITVHNLIQNINPITIDSTQNLGSHNLRSINYIYPEFISEGKIDSHQIFTKQLQIIYPGPNYNILPPPVHELIRPETNIILYNQIYSPAYEMGYFDCLALGRDINIDPHYDLSFENLNTSYFFSVDSINLNYKQDATYEQRLAGEGASPNTFKVDKREHSLTFKMPIKVESWGYVDPAFAALYDYCIQGFKGNSTVFMGRMKADSDAAIGATTFMKIDNIADFINMGSNFTAYIRSDNDIELGETVTVSSVSKSEKTLYFSSSTVNSHTPSKTYIWTKPTNPESNREPSFSLYSLREGLFSGCMVDSINFNMTPGNSIIADITIKFTNLDRKYQKNFLSEFDTIVANINNRRPNYLLNGSLVSMEFANSTVEYFGLGRADLSKLFHGFQEYDLRNFEINQMTLNISNNLEPIYSLNAKDSNSKEKFNKNTQPYAFYSKGRSITGNINYSSPIKPWLFAEKLAGTSELSKNGIRFNFGPFKLELPDLVWIPESSESSVESTHKKTVSWAVVTPKLVFSPYLVPTGSY